VTAVTPTFVRPDVPYPTIGLLLGDRWRPSQPHVDEPVFDPATDEVIGFVPTASTTEVAAALEAADAAFIPWKATSPEKRCRVLQRAAQNIQARREEIAAIITLELGKPLSQSRAEVDTAIGVVEWNAQESRRTYGRVIPAARGRRQLVLQEPVGPVAAFAPWNAPALTPSRKISSALAAGCTVVLKPSEETPGTSVCLAQCFLDAGLPPGALNILFGNPHAVAEQLITSPVIRAVTFTGSTVVGRALAVRAVELLKRPVMELGGHAPVVVCEDVDPQQVASAAARAAYRNAGQVCTSPTRFFVDTKIYDAFVDSFTAATAALRVGNGFEPDVDVGPLANRRRIDAMTDLVEDARRHGARVPSGGTPITGPGCFWAPTVLADVTQEAAVATTEPFGPIAALTPVDGIDEAIELANSLPFALAGYALSHDSKLVARLTEALDCGALAINHWQVSGPETPFGGHRDSGFGLEGGIEGIAALQQTKFVSEE
jgi:succinate-semialdehyde dehydrogenase/glutarate-semialdehyde dehydrogenase